MRGEARHDGLSWGEGYRPNVIGDLIGLHMRYYAPHWHLGQAFEVMLAREAGSFFDRFDPHRDHFAWVAVPDDRLVGTVAVDGQDARGPRLRWFVVDPRLQGRGLGTRLLTGALRFCDGHGSRRIWLTTFPGLDAARHLYESHGFAPESPSSPVRPWGGGLQEQVYGRSAAEAASRGPGRGPGTGDEALR